jgi:outer membrane lipoprotein-sorting protein
MKTTTKILTVLMLAASAAFAQEAPVANQQNEQAKPPESPLTDVQTVVEKANIAAYYQGDDGRAKVKMTITDKKGNERIKEFVILRKDESDGGDQKYYLYFEKPVDERRTVYMVLKHADPNKDDDRWLYLPGLDLVKRIAAGDKRTSFVGSDFLYEDVSGRSLAEDEHQPIQTTDDLYIVKNIPKQPDTVEFSYYNVSIDRRNFIPMKMEYYDKSGKLYRTIESVEVETIDEYPTVVKSLVTDLARERKTEMEFTDVKYNIGLKDDIFTERYLRRPPREVRR